MGPRPAEHLIPDDGSGPVQKVQREELAEQVRRALETLNERQRLAVLLNKFEDMGYAEIAEVMSMSVKAVKSLLSRARENLRAALSPYICPEDPAVPHTPEDQDQR